MALQKQLVHLNLTGGIQNKDDQFLTIPSKLTAATDVEFDDQSSVVRRGGQAAQTLATISAFEAIGTAKRIFPNGSEAVIEAATGDYKVSSGGTVQVYTKDSLGGAPRVYDRAALSTRRDGAAIARFTVLGAGYPKYTDNVDSAVIGNIQFSCWETEDPAALINTLRYQFTEVSSNKVIVSGTFNTIAGKTRCKPRVVALGTKFALYFGAFTIAANTFEIRRVVFNSDGTVANAEAVVVTSSATAGTTEGSDRDAILFDVHVATDATQIGLVYRDINVASTLRFYTLSTSDFITVGTSANVAPSATPTSLTALVSSNGGTYRTHALFSVGTTTLRAINMNNSTAALSAETTVGTGAAGSVTGRSAAIQVTAGGVITVAWDSENATSTSSTLRLSTFTDTYGTLGECPTFSPWYVAGRIGSINSRLYLPMAYVGAEGIRADNTYFVIDLTSALRNIGVATNSQPPHVVARIDCGEGSMYRNRWSGHQRVQSFSLTNLNVLVYSYTKFETDLVFAGTSNSTGVCVATAMLDFSSQLGHVEVNGLTWLAGGCPLIYDGQRISEEGFHHAPALPVVDAPAAAGTYGPFSTASGGVYTFCFTIGWMDDRGNWHESAPSNQRIVTFAGANTHWTPTLIVPPSLKQGTVLRGYRTKESSTDTSLYLFMEYGKSEVLSDTALASSEQLYTAGGVLPNTPAPSCRHAAIFQKRVVLTGCGDGSRVHWSKQTTPGYGVEFSAGDPTHQLTVPASAGRAVATQEMDDRLFILCENAVGMISGSGPAPTGTQGQYSDFTTVVSEAGCSWDSPKSAIRGSEGIWFRSPQGIRLISHSGQIARGQDGKQVGSEVDPLVVGSPVAVSGSSKQQVRFYCASGRVLVWDAQWTQWSMFTGMSNIDAVYADGRFYHLSNYSAVTPLLRYTDNAANADVDDGGNATTAFFGRIELPWLAMAGIQGFQRVYRLMLLARNVDASVLPQDIGMQLYYDYSPDQYTLDAPYVTVTPASGGIVQFQHHFVNQKCEAVKIALYFRPTTAGNAGRLRLTDITLQVGVKPGYYKLPSSQRV